MVRAARLVLPRWARPDLPTSLRTQLLVVQAGLFLITLIGFVGLYLAFDQGDMRYHVVDDLYGMAGDIGRATFAAPDGSVRLTVPRDLAERIAAFPGAMYGVVDLRTGSTVAGSTESRPPPELPLAGSVAEGWIHYVDREGATRNGVFRRIGPTGRYLAYFLPKEAEDGVVSEGLGDELGTEILPVFLPMAVLGLILTGLTVTRMLRPLGQAADEAAALSPRGAGAVGRRISTDGVPREIRPVVDAVNAALAQLDAALDQQRRFNANTAHQLRTPLAILRTRIESLPDSPIRAELGRDIDRMARLVSQLLLASKLEAGRIDALREVDLTELARDVVANIAPLAHRHDRDVALDAPGPLPAHIAPGAVEEALRNLLENALRHTPARTTVTVSVLPGAAIEVRDHGPGVPVHLRQQIFEPFWSGCGEPHGGAGLGLAIVREAAALHGGQATIRDADGGGAIFRIDLPQVEALRSPIWRSGAGRSVTQGPVVDLQMT